MQEGKEQFLDDARTLFESGGTVFLRSVEWPRGSLSPHLVFEGSEVEFEHFSPGDEIEFAWRWRVECGEVDSMEIASHEISSIEMPRQHPFLWHLSSRPHSLHFRGRPRDADALIGSLLRAHEAATAGLLPFSGRRLAWHLEGGYGILASGPEEMLRAFAAELEKQEIQASIFFGGRPEALEREDTFLGYSLLLWERTSYVIADEFRFIREA